MSRMNTQMSYSSTMPALPPDQEKSEWQEQQPDQPQQQQQQQQEQYYYMPEQTPVQVEKSSFFDGISKQILFLIFLAFVFGLFIGKSMNAPIIIQRTT